MLEVGFEAICYAPQVDPRDATTEPGPASTLLERMSIYVEGWARRVVRRVE